MTQTRVSGVSRADVDLAGGKAQVEYDAAQAGLKDLEGAVEEAGFDVG